MKKTAKTLAILSPVTAVASFLTLGNAIVVHNDVLNSVGIAIALVSLIAFAASLIILIITGVGRGPSSGQEPAQAKVPRQAPPWYRLAKLSTGLLVVLGLYVGVPMHIFFTPSGPSLDPLNMLLVLLTVLPLYAMPLPYGIVVWPLTVIGVGLILFHRRRWIVLDSVAVVLVVLIIAGANAALSGSGQQSSQPVESVRGTETVKITASNGEGGGTPGVGICITARIQVPREDAPDMICGVTDGDGKEAFEVRPGRYYIYLDLRSRDEFNFDPKYPREYVEWEVLPQSTNEIEVMITPKK